MGNFWPIVSSSLRDYFYKVVFDTELPLEFRHFPKDHCQNKYKGMCVTDLPDRIRILLCLNNFPTQIDYESCLAHEVTHGWLARAKGYVRPLSTGDEVINKRARMIGNMFEDLVIYKIVHNKGFLAVSPLDLKDLDNQAEIIEEGPIEYIALPLDEGSQTIMRIVKHICFTYSFKFVKGDTRSEAIYQRYFHAYEKRYLTDDRSHIEVVHRILEEQNVFYPAGFQNAVKGLAQHFGLGTVQWDSIKK